MEDYRFSVDDYLNSIKINDKKAIALNTLAIKSHLDIILNNLLFSYNYEKLSRIFYALTLRKLNYTVSNVNINIIKQEVKIISWLIHNIDYLYTINDKNKNIYIINIYYYLTLIDFDRIEFVEINSNKGRTIIADYMINNINNYLDEITNNFKYFDDKTDIKKALIRNEK